MVNRASIPDYKALVTASAALSAQHPTVRDWTGSPFDWLLALPSATLGAVGRNLIESWASGLGFYQGRERHNNQHYLVLNGHRVQVKLSTLWDAGHYRFQQIRDQPYDDLLCVGISPNDIHAWFIPKGEALLHLRGTAGQHTGAGATETHWLNVDPTQPQGWLSEFGDQLSDVRSLIQAIR